MRILQIVHMENPMRKCSINTRTAHKLYIQVLWEIFAPTDPLFFSIVYLLWHCKKHPKSACKRLLCVYSVSIYIIFFYSTDSTFFLSQKFHLDQFFCCYSTYTKSTRNIQHAHTFCLNKYRGKRILTTKSVFN